MLFICVIFISILGYRRKNKEKSGNWNCIFKRRREWRYLLVRIGLPEDEIDKYDIYMDIVIIETYYMYVR